MTSNHKQEEAPDGSMVTPLWRNDHASVCLCTLKPGDISKPVAHRTVEEFWTILSGEGELYLAGSYIPLTRDLHVAIETGQVFQFRNTGVEPLKILITTAPPWPNADEAVSSTEGAWKPNL